MAKYAFVIFEGRVDAYKEKIGKLRNLVTIFVGSFSKNQCVGREALEGKDKKGKLTFITQTPTWIIKINGSHYKEVLSNFMDLQKKGFLQFICSMPILSEFGKRKYGILASHLTGKLIFVNDGFLVLSLVISLVLVESNAMPESVYILKSGLLKKETQIDVFSTQRWPISHK